MNWDEARRKLIEILVTKVVDFTPEEMERITKPQEPDKITEEIIFIKEDILTFHKRQAEVWEARLRWLEAQEGEVAK